MAKTLNKLILTRLLKHIMRHIWIICLLWGYCGINTATSPSYFLLLQRVCSLVISSFSCMVGSCSVWVVCLVPLGLLFFFNNGMIKVHAIILSKNWIHRGIGEWSLVDIIRSNDYVGVFHDEAVSLAHIQLYKWLLTPLQITRLKICTCNHVWLLV